MGRYLFFVLLLPLGSASAFETDPAINSFSNELTDCAGFYLISSRSVRAQPELAEQKKQAAVSALAFAKELINEDMIRVKTEKAIKSMLEEVNGDAVKWSNLIKKYSAKCDEIVANPGKRADYWFKKPD
ncbi:hypothetical protein [Pseudomonas sp. NPDC099000]|uniref:hypothetical protein n=1 Tax=Pseudomonas sp. NPDC099000 TaxID=3364488 RepID=UPI00383BC96A